MYRDALIRAPAVGTVARLMTIGRDDLSKSQTFTVAAIEAGAPQLLEAREVAAVALANKTTQQRLEKG